MIDYHIGDATRPIGDGQKIIAHCCNDIGAWGSGFVVALSRRWAEPEARYRAEPQYVLGHVQFVPVEENIIVANIIGQTGVRSQRNPRPVSYEALKLGFSEVADGARFLGASVHMPRIGCGLAGGKWEIVSGLIEETMGDLSVTVYDLPRRQGA